MIRYKKGRCAASAFVIFTNYGFNEKLVKVKLWNNYKVLIPRLLAFVFDIGGIVFMVFSVSFF